jgi:hypothetical protein
MDETIYLSAPWYQQLMANSIDFAWVTIAAHEWGHHVQFLLQIDPEAGNAFELQADCLAGSYAKDAAQHALVERGDITEAVGISGASGDPNWLPADRPGAHGSGDERLTSFMTGYINGVADCGTPLTTSPQSPSRTPMPPVIPIPTPSTQGSALRLESLIPVGLTLSQGEHFHFESEGVSSFDDMVTGLPDLAQARKRLLEWGWEENFYRVYVSDNPTANVANMVVLGIHRFSSADGAAEALPQFAALRRSGSGYQHVDVGLFSDQTEAMAGRGADGNEFIIYARRGNLIFRATGIATAGDPTGNVLEALLVPLTELADDPRVVSPQLFSTLPPVSDLLTGLVMTEEHARSAATIATTFPNVAEAEQLFQEWGWRENAARVFAGSTSSGTNRIEVSVFRLANEEAASFALPYLLEARAEALGLSEFTPPPARADENRAISGAIEGGREVTVYLRRGRELFRVTAFGGNDPLNDLATLFASW